LVDNPAQTERSSAQPDAPAAHPSERVPSGSRGDPRWHCARTHPQDEFRALAELLSQGFETYLPLHLDRPRGPIVPLFSRYIFCRFSVRDDPWGPIRHTRGVVGLICCQAAGWPSPLPHGVVEDLIVRTSARRVVDDPGEAVMRGPGKPAWRGLGSMNAADRTGLLLRLFGERVALAA
jgi:hypothetical protein